MLRVLWRAGPRTRRSDWDFECDQDDISLGQHWSGPVDIRRDNSSLAPIEVVIAGTPSGLIITNPQPVAVFSLRKR